MENFDSEEEKVHMIEITVNIRTRITLKEPPNEPGENVDILLSKQEEFEQYELSVKVFPSGIIEEHKGFMAIELCIADLPPFEGIVIVTLIDSSEARRFSRSFTRSYTTTPYFRGRELYFKGDASQ